MAGRQGRTQVVPAPAGPGEDPTLGLYLHIPFCQAICGYCNFNRGLFDADLKTQYVAALEREIRDADLDEAAFPRVADTIFFGGGTPSLLAPAEVAGLIAACRDRYDVTDDAEITLETNPETATVELLSGFRAAGVNRISFGVQSFDAAELRRLDRIHTADRAIGAVGFARQAGFDNVSLDLMLWLPGQSRASALRSASTAVNLAPEHLSIYLLEIYPNSPLKDAMARAGAPGGRASAAEWAQIAEDDAADMYLDVFATLDRAGYDQYEISNAARPGFWSRHNVKYWQGGHWRGFGCGAHSTVGGRRWRNVASTSEYIAHIRDGQDVRRDRQVLAGDARVAEAIFMGLRLAAGIDRRNFSARYGVDPWSRHDTLFDGCVADGLMWRHGPGFGLTRPGMLVANEILAAVV